MTLQQKKSKEFSENLEKFQKYRDYLQGLYDNGIITEKEHTAMLEAAADAFDL